MYLLIQNPYRPPAYAEQVIMIRGEEFTSIRSADNSLMICRPKIALYTEYKEQAKSCKSKIASDVI